jgi:hypothetical protein
MTKKTPYFRAFAVSAAAVLSLAAALTPLLPAQSTGPQQLSFAGLHVAANQGQFNAVASDSSGNLYLLLDQKDGIRVLKTDPGATTILDQIRLGAPGDVGVALVLDAANNVYITGTSNSGLLAGSSGAAFAAPADASVNSFVARFNPSLALQFLTFGGSARTVATAIAVTPDAVFITGLTFGSGLPVTPSAIIQAPAFGSMQNGFVEKFSLTGTSLLYATYLSGQGGDTAPSVIAADTSDNAYVAGFTTTTGFPAIAALIPRALSSSSGFLTKLTAAGDGITFSTFLPGGGITSIAVDPAAHNLLLSGPIALGQFPVATVASPLINTIYQVLLRMPLDGSSVLSSTLIAPGLQSFLTPGPNGTVWVDGTLSTPLLPLTPVSSIGTGYAVRVSPTGPNGQAIVDQTARFGGLAANNPNFASIPLTLTSLAVDASGSAILAGSVAPTASASLLVTQTFDLPLLNTPTAALPSAVHDAVLAPGSCNGSLCAGTAAYLARLTPTAGASLALSTDASPNLILRNLGTTQATGLTLFASGYSFTTTCGATLASGDECTIALSPGGPGTLNVQASNATSHTTSLAAVTAAANPIAFSPHEIDFGIQTSTSPVLTRTITVTNLTQLAQTFNSSGPPVVNPGSASTPPFTESTSDCLRGALSTIKLLAPGATCHITLAFTASADATKEGPLQSNWTIGAGSVLVTGFQQVAALTLSATEIDFGTQFFGGLRTARYLYLSNNSAVALSHTPVALGGNSPFTLTDNCPTQLQPHTVCQIQLGYLSAVPTSSDTTTLSLDQGLSALVTGTTIPPPGVTGSGSTPTLAVSPTTISFSNAVVVSGISSTTQTVFIQNTGTSSFPLALVLTGDFTDQTNCTASLAAGASCSVVLTFAPAQPGARTGLLSVTAGSTSPVYVNLSGTATPILPANNGTLDFGSVSVGQPLVNWYKVSQPFTTLTAATQSPTFHVLLVEDIGYGHGAPAASAFLPATTGSCVNCWLGVQFTPTATGAATATLSLASSTAGNPYTLLLTGSGLSAAGIQISPATQDFASIAINSSSPGYTFILTNLNTGPVTLNSPTLSGDFALGTNPGGCASTLPSNASCDLTVLFAPTAAGQRTGTLTVSTSAGSATSALTGFGAPDPGIAFNPSAIIFNNVAGPTALTQTITVTNTGASPAVVGTPVNASSAFAPTSTCTTLAPAATCVLTVAFTPAAATVTDTIQLPISVNAGGNPVLTTYTIPLSSTYTTASAGLQIIPGTADYGPAAVNALAGTRAFTINNLSPKTLALNVNIPRQFVLAGDPCASLAPSGTCTFSVTFLPITNGENPGTLYATGTPSDATPPLTGLGYIKGYGNGTNTLSITGNLSPGQLVNFGQVPSGQTAQQTLTLTNTSSAAVSTATSAITVRRITSQWPFLSTTTCGSTLATGQACTVTITYSPLNQVPSGTASPTSNTDAGTLTIESDAVSGPDQIALSGIATATSVAAPSNTAPMFGFTVSQNSLTFPATAIGFTSAPQTVTLLNTGTIVLHVTALTASSDFTVAGTCPSLVPGASCPLTIAFAPQVASLASGPRPGTIEITSDSGTSLEFITLLGAANPSILSFSPASLNFGQQLVGTLATLPIVVTNTGTLPAIFSGVNAIGDYAATGTCPAPGNPLPASAMCTVQVGFTPTTTGVRAGTLSVASSVSASPLNLAVTGIGVQSHLNISPASLAFGTLNVGSASSLTLTLANTGTAAITGVALTSTSDFAVTSPCSFTTLSAGTSCSVTVTFTPTAGGARTGTLNLASSDPSSPNAIALSGNGVSVATPGSFTMTVDGGASSTQTVRQAYAASYSLALTPLSGFTGNVVLTCSPVVAAVNATCSIPNASLTLTSASQSSTVTINTVTSIARTRPALHLRSFNPVTLCILAPAVFFFWRFRKTLASRPASLLLALLCTTLMMLTSGCGTGINGNVHLTTPGNYQYVVTASSTNGTVITQTVTLNLAITD